MSESNSLDTEALERLIKAMETFRGELQVNRTSLTNAANVCSQTMGNDEISKKHIARLNEALRELESAQTTADQAIADLREDLRRALEATEI